MLQDEGSILMGIPHATRGVQGSGGETWGKETTGETQTQMGG